MNFALILFMLLVVSGALWVLDHFVASKRRSIGSKTPWWVEYGASFFPVILVVFSLRSFVVEPFKIPSGSMIPTLLVGDFILVNKWTYGIRLPVINKKIIDVNLPQRGDVMVFRFPADPSLDYIKRVVGLPGDKIEYMDKKLTINGVAMPQSPACTTRQASPRNWAKSSTRSSWRMTHRLLFRRPSSTRSATTAPILTAAFPAPFRPVTIS